VPGSLKGAHLSKQALEIHVLSEPEVRELLDLRDLLDALADGFRALSAGEVEGDEERAATLRSGEQGVRSECTDKVAGVLLGKLVAVKSLKAQITAGCM
jgi:hypothetical protein